MIAAITVLVAVVTVGCGNKKGNKEDEPEQQNERTLIMYFPWSTNLTSYFLYNIDDMRAAIAKNGIKNQKVVVIIAGSHDNASMYELVESNGHVINSTLKNYENPEFTKEEWLTGMLSDVARFAPAKKYSMIIGAHGMGWLPVSSNEIRQRLKIKLHTDFNQDKPITRFFGGLTPEYQTEVSTLAQSIRNTGMKMEYILFDDCYMATAEVAYELRTVTDYLIASTSEIHANGLPYADMDDALLGEPDYEKICNAFHNHYANSFGTLSVIDCSKMDELAATMKAINQKYEFDMTKINGLQRLDGYSPVIFFDAGNYLDQLITDTAELSKAKSVLAEAAAYTTSTDQLYSMNYGYFKVKSNCGICISDPSTNMMATGKKGTSWWKATH